MTVYNGAKFISSAIHSILDQTMDDLELIVVNDGSNDATESIILDIRDSRIKYLKNHQNKGQSYSRNRAIGESEGKYIAIMDADDIACNQRLEKQLTFLEGNPEISLCGSWVNIIDGNGEFVSVRKLPKDDAVIKLRLLFGCPIVHPTVMWRKSDFQKYNLYYDEQYVYAQDFDLWARALWHVKFHILDEPLLSFRFRNKESITYSKKNEQLKFARSIVERNIAALTGMSYNNARASFFRRILLYRRIVSSLSVVEDKDLKVQFFRQKILASERIPHAISSLLRKILIQ